MKMEIVVAAPSTGVSEQVNCGKDALVQAAETVKRGEIGKLVLCQFALYGRVDPSVKYYHTGWRRDNSFPGGFFRMT